MKESIFGMCLGVAMVIILTIIFSHFEAKTFNRCTGSEVTTFEAVFANFRITDCEKE